jgi:hypothetical protein
MKTTIEIPAALFREAKKFAARHGIPLREVVERGLRQVLRGTRPARPRFRLKTVTTAGEGVACGEDWSTIRSLTYEGHGG